MNLHIRVRYEHIFVLCLLAFPTGLTACFFSSIYRDILCIIGSSYRNQILKKRLCMQFHVEFFFFVWVGKTCIWIPWNFYYIEFIAAHHKEGNCSVFVSFRIYGWSYTANIQIWLKSPPLSIRVSWDGGGPDPRHLSKN